MLDDSRLSLDDKDDLIRMRAGCVQEARHRVSKMNEQVDENTNAQQLTLTKPIGGGGSKQ